MVTASKKGNVVELKVNLEILIDAFNLKKDTIRLLPDFAVPSTDLFFTRNFANSGTVVIFTVGSDGVLYLLSYGSLPTNGYSLYDTLTYFV